MQTIDEIGQAETERKISGRMNFPIKFFGRLPIKQKDTEASKMQLLPNRCAFKLAQGQRLGTAWKQIRTI